MREKLFGDDLLPEIPLLSRREAILARVLVKAGAGLSFTKAGSQCGTARGVVSFAFRSLEKKGYLDRRGHHRFDGCYVDVFKLAVALRLRDREEAKLPKTTRKKPANSRGLKGGRTRYPKSVADPTGRRVLQSGANNVKLGLEVKKGRHAGRQLYSLTLEEGHTCPPCDLSEVCYGSNMPFARRWKHGVDLEQAIASQVSRFQKPLLVRLHVLGDFYSTDYAEFWANLGVPVFGYSHLPAASSIGRVIYSQPWETFSIRKSWKAHTSDPVNKRGAVTVEKPEDAKEFDAILCPQQYDKTASCAACGLCWQTEQNIAFVEH